MILIIILTITWLIQESKWSIICDMHYAVAFVGERPRAPGLGIS